jgi:hypothetical protein
MAERKSVGEMLGYQAARWGALWERISSVYEPLGTALAEVHSQAELRSEIEVNLRKLREAVGRFEDMAVRPRVYIATTGTTSSGKSTLCNLLLGEELLPKAVQEMSAGAVTVHHDPHRRCLVVEETRGATWATGLWQPSSAAEVREHLERIMDSYRGQVHQDRRGTRAQMDAPRFTLYWPTRLGQKLGAFGLPEGAQLSLVDLPGLSYSGDEHNGKVMRQHAQKALCLVTYNSEETDQLKQAELLRQVVEQVKNLRGSPARMLFVLNRIDAFRRDRDPAESMRRFHDAITRQIRERIREELSEYRAEAEALTPIPLSSEPALYAVLAEQQAGAEQAVWLERLEREYRSLFGKEVMRKLPRDPEDWSGEQRQAFLAEARQRSWLDAFEQRLGEHIVTHLPELLLPDLMEEAYLPARRALEGLDALLNACSKQEMAQVAAAMQELEELNQQALETIENVAGVLHPLAEFAERLQGSDGKQENQDYLAVLKGVGKQFADRSQEWPENPERQQEVAVILQATQEGVGNTIALPLQRLCGYVFECMAGSAVTQADLADPALHRALEALRRSPYGHTWAQGGEFSGDEALAVGAALGELAQALSVLATELTKREVDFLRDRLEHLWNRFAEILAGMIEERVAPLFEARGMPGLRGVFRGSFHLDPPEQMPVLSFPTDFRKWERPVREEASETVRTRKRRWYFLWLVATEALEVRKVVRERKEEGIAVAKLGDVLEAFGSATSLAELNSAISQWFGGFLEKYKVELEARLAEGTKQYRVALQCRQEEIERHGQARIKELEERSARVKELQEELDGIRQWRESRA